MKKKLVTVFMGTPDFAVPTLRALAESTELVLVVTQPDRPVGRGRKMASPPVKTAAIDLGVAVIAPEVVRGKRFASRIADLKPDILVTAAYGRILGRSLLATPTLGCLNVHASLLPKLRGAAPINWAIINGDEEAGVSIMSMEEGLDTGPVYRSTAVQIGPQETAGDLTGRLAELGAAVLIEVLGEIGEIEPVPQDHSLATHAPALQKKDGRMDWAKSAAGLHAHVRGMHPWPCASTLLEGQPIKVHDARVLSHDEIAGKAGEVTAHTADGVDVACGKGVLRLTALQLPGRKRLGAAQFITGCKIKSGTVLS